MPIKDLLFWSPLYDLARLIALKMQLYTWKLMGEPSPPPPLVKQRVVQEYTQRFTPLNFIETGTYFGDMVNATRKTFRQIFSIELDPTLYKRAKRRFSHLNHISILQGDSAVVLPKILANIHEPCLFWLDAHHSGGITAQGSTATPIRQELAHILKHPILGHVILIDDARCFTGENDYPTINELKELIFARPNSQNLMFVVKDDIIRIHPKT